MPKPSPGRRGELVCLSGEKAGERLPLARIAGMAPFSGGPISAEVGLNAQGYLPAFGVHICDAEVDPETGVVTIVRYTAVQDVGRAIHPTMSKARSRAARCRASAGR